MGTKTPKTVNPIFLQQLLHFVEEWKDFLLNVYFPITLLNDAVSGAAATQLQHPVFHPDLWPLSMQSSNILPLTVGVYIRWFGLLRNPKDVCLSINQQL